MQLGYVSLSTLPAISCMLTTAWLTSVNLVRRWVHHTSSRHGSWDDFILEDADQALGKPAVFVQSPADR